MKTTKVAIKRLALNGLPSCATTADKCPMMAVRQKFLARVRMVCQYTGSELVADRDRIAPCDGCPVHPVARTSSDRSRQQRERRLKRLAADPGFAESCRTAARNHYRRKRGIPLDAPVRKYERRSK